MSVEYISVAQSTTVPPPAERGWHRCALMVKIAAACYTSSEPWCFFTHAVWNSRAGRGIRGALFNEGLIDDAHQITPKGRAWVEAIIIVPFPVETVQYVIPKRGS